MDLWSAQITNRWFSSDTFRKHIGGFFCHLLDRCQMVPRCRWCRRIMRCIKTLQGWWRLCSTDRDPSNGKVVLLFFFFVKWWPWWWSNDGFDADKTPKLMFIFLSTWKLSCFFYEHRIRKVRLQCQSCEVQACWKFCLETGKQSFSQCQLAILLVANGKTRLDNQWLKPVASILIDQPKRMMACPGNASTPGSP